MATIRLVINPEQHLESEAPGPESLRCLQVMTGPGNTQMTRRNGFHGPIIAEPDDRSPAPSRPASSQLQLTPPSCKDHRCRMVLGVASIAGGACGLRAASPGWCGYTADRSPGAARSAAIWILAVVTTAMSQPAAAASASRAESSAVWMPRCRWAGAVAAPVSCATPSARWKLAPPAMTPSCNAA